MGTKNNPGEFDCYANAAPDEPMFILLGRDRHMQLLVRLWALLRHREGEPEEKIAEALQCAKLAEEWQKKLCKNPFAERPHYVEALLMAATENMDEHPEDYDDSCCCDECSIYR